MSREISDSIRNDLKYTYYIMKTRMQTNTQHPHSGILSSSEQLSDTHTSKIILEFCFDIKIEFKQLFKFFFLL